MLLCCLYFGMLFSDWGDAQQTINDEVSMLTDADAVMFGLSPEVKKMTNVKLVETNAAMSYYKFSGFTVVVKFINLIIATGFLIVSMALSLCCPDRIL